MSTDPKHTRSTSSDAPPAAANVATAYPPQQPSSPSKNLLILVTLLSTLAVALLHYLDYPVLTLAKSSIAEAITPAEAPSFDNLPIADRLAVCFSGHVGTLPTVYEQNLKAIRVFDRTAAVFYSLNLRDDYRHERADAHYMRDHAVEDLQPVFDAVSPVKVDTFTPESVSVPPQSNCHRRDAESHQHYSHNYMQFHAAAACYANVREHEIAYGEKFAWILNLRPDMEIMLKHPEPDTVPRVHLSGSAMALVPREMADTYFSVVDAFSEGRCTPLDDMGIEPCTNYSYEEDSTECLIIKWLKKHDLVPSNGVYANRRIVYPEGD